MVKVKVGPINVQYKGNASFQEKDTSAHRAVIKANGKETRGRGNAAAVVTAELKDQGDSTSCLLTTDLTISGKAAQFGRGALSEVAAKLIGQFAERLEADVLAGSVTPTPVAVTVVAAAQRDDAASVDVLGVLAAPVAKRVLPIAAALAAGLAISWLLGRRRP